MPKKTKEKKWHACIMVDGKQVTEWEPVGDKYWEPDSKDAAYDAASDNLFTDRYWVQVEQR